jgi:hypothetical protein
MAFQSAAVFDQLNKGLTAEAAKKVHLSLPLNIHKENNDSKINTVSNDLQ